MPGGPDGVDASCAAKQLDVVVVSAADASPAQDRAWRRVHHVGGLLQREDLRRGGDGDGFRRVSRLVDRPHRVEVLLAGVDPVVGEGGAAAVEDGRARLVPADLAPDADEVGRAGRAPAQDVRRGGALFGHAVQRRRSRVVRDMGRANGRVSGPVGAASGDGGGWAVRASVGRGGAACDAGQGVRPLPATRPGGCTNRGGPVVARSVRSGRSGAWRRS